MTKQPLNLALVLHMHQPCYNLDGPPQESDVARDVFSQTMHPYTYPAEAIMKHENAKVTVNFTGSLIEQLNELTEAQFDSRLNGLWSKYKETAASGRTEFTSCAYFHSILPLIPESDRHRQIQQHLALFAKTFGTKPSGLWLPELAYTPQIIPALESNGIKWIIVDGTHIVNANKDESTHRLLYKPHYVEFEGHRVIVIPRDRMLSIAQQSGYDPTWLKQEIERAVEPHNDGKFLLTIATDGENGWFRHSGENAGFWGWFFEPLMDRIEKDADFQFIKPTFITEYLKEHPPTDAVAIEGGSWNVPDAPDDGRFLKWTGGKERQDTWSRVLEASRFVDQARQRIAEAKIQNSEDAEKTMGQAERWMLMAEASDNFWWGAKDWLEKSITCSLRAEAKAKEALKLCGLS